MHIPRPQPGDYIPFYETYIRLVPEGDFTALLEAQAAELAAFFGELTEEQAAHRYAADKWSLKEVLGHIIDTERTMAYRLFCVARGDTTLLSNFNKDRYLSEGCFDNRPIAGLLDEFRAVRQASIVMLKGFAAEHLQRAGTVNDNRFTAAALAYFLPGHPAHHMNIVRERYAPGIC